MLVMAIVGLRLRSRGRHGCRRSFDFERRSGALTKIRPFSSLGYSGPGDLIYSLAGDGAASARNRGRDTVYYTNVQSPECQGKVRDRGRRDLSREGGTKRSARHRGGDRLHRAVGDVRGMAWAW